MKIKNTAIELIKEDITTIHADAIVNAANSSLLGGGGVDGAIHRKGGSQILEECKIIRNKQGGCKTGEAVYTTAGLLSAKYVIHTVGPIWNKNNTNNNQLLANCYYNSLNIAKDLQITSIAFPNISTGVYKFPKSEAAEIAINAVKSFLETENCQLKTVIFVCFDDENYKLYQEILAL